MSIEKDRKPWLSVLGSVAVVIGAILIVLSCLYALNFWRLKRLAEPEWSRNQLWAKRIAHSCKGVDRAAVSNVIDQCSSSSDNCRAAFLRFEESLIVRAAEDPDCLEVTGEFVSDKFERVGAMIEGPPEKSAISPLREGWRELLRIKKKIFPPPPPQIPTPEEVDAEFRRVQRAMGLRETGSPKWGNAVPPSTRKRSTFRNVGRSISAEP